MIWRDRNQSRMTHFWSSPGKSSHLPTWVNLWQERMTGEIYANICFQSWQILWVFFSFFPSIPGFCWEMILIYWHCGAIFSCDQTFVDVHVFPEGFANKSHVSLESTSSKNFGIFFKTYPSAFLRAFIGGDVIFGRGIKVFLSGIHTFVGLQRNLKPFLY